MCKSWDGDVCYQVAHCSEWPVVQTDGNQRWLPGHTSWSSLQLNSTLKSQHLLHQYIWQCMWMIKQWQTIREGLSCLFVRGNTEMKIKNGRLLVAQKICFCCIISSSFLFICPAHPFSPKVKCCVKNVYYKDVAPWRENPRNIIHSFFALFYWVQTCHSREAHWMFCVQYCSSGSRYLTANNYCKMGVCYDVVPEHLKPEHRTEQ